MKKSVIAYFDDHPEYWNKYIYPYIEGKKWSGRLLDHAVARYFREHNCCWTLANGKIFNARVEAQLMLFGVHKRGFDPFRRRLKDNDSLGYFTYGNPPARVSVGLLNWFRWAIRNGVLDYIDTHEAEIRAHMKQNNHSAAAATTDEDDNTVEKPRKKRRRISSSISSTIIFNGNVEIKVNL